VIHCRGFKQSNIPDIDKQSVTFYVAGMQERIRAIGVLACAEHSTHDSTVPDATRILIVHKTFDS